jgi:hypothetical protein
MSVLYTTLLAKKTDLENHIFEKDCMWQSNASIWFAKFACVNACAITHANLHCNSTEPQNHLYEYTKFDWLLH